MPGADYDLDSFVAEYYDFVPPVAGRRDIDFYLECARSTADPSGNLSQAKPILELGCGTGRVLLPLAEAGHRVIGLDLSEHMLSRAQAKLNAKPAELRRRARLVRGDMTSFNLGEMCRLVVIPFRPFQHLLELDDQMNCLRCAHGHLDAGGKLALDFFHTDPRRMHDAAFTAESNPQPAVALSDGRQVRLAERTVAFHRATQRNDVELIYYVTHPEGRSERLVFPFTIRYFFPYEVEHLLARCGFAVTHVYGNFDRSPLGDNSPEMIYIAQKYSAG